MIALFAALLLAPQLPEKPDNFAFNKFTVEFTEELTEKEATEVLKPLKVKRIKSYRFREKPDQQLFFVEIDSIKDAYKDIQRNPKVKKVERNHVYRIQD